MLRRILDRATNNWALKLTALALAFLLWSTVRAGSPGQWEADVEVRAENDDRNWVVSAITPAAVRVTFRGPFGELLRTASDRPLIVVPLSGITDSTELHVLRRSWLRMPAGTDRIEIADFRPSSVRINFDKMSTRLLPLAARIRGEPAVGTRLTGALEIEPPIVRASGARRTLARYDSLRLPAIDLSGRSARDTIEITIDTTGTGLVVTPRTVRVILPLQPIADSSGLPLIGVDRRRPGG